MTYLSAGVAPTTISTGDNDGVIVDLEYARRVARENAGRIHIDEDEITSRGVARLAGVNINTVITWSKWETFPARLRHGVFPLKPVLTFLLRFHPEEESPGPDSLLTLTQFAHRVGVTPPTTDQYWDHPYLLEKADDDNIDHKGVQRWRLADLEDFWHNQRPGQGRGPRPTRQGRPHPKRPHKREA
ncbi:hypothetical protein [Nonomuraea jabiensis]|uniref:hypothetical protein n=1 Tax=Nonomuraea jabiensis TaxID=882448 RepID=UPI003D73F74D